MMKSLGNPPFVTKNKGSSWPMVGGRGLHVFPNMLVFKKNMFLHQPTHTNAISLAGRATGL